jgi:MYXO-CTERM domain-containing protein
MRFTTALAVSVLAAVAGSASAAVTTYSSAASFAAAITGAPQYFEDYSSVAAGPATSLNFGPVNGFAYSVTASATAPSGNTLYNDTGLLSTNNAVDDIVFTFTGDAVYAFGGNFWTTNINVLPVSGTITITVAGGGTYSYASSAVSDYFGLVSDTPITGFSISGSYDGTPNTQIDWPTADNVTVAGVVPAPGAAALLGVAALAAGRRRRA